MSSKMISIVISVVCWFTLSSVDGLPTTTLANNYIIGYRESEENHRIKNKDGRLPLFAPSMCPDNELFYPGDQASDWICDCRPAHLYHPESNKCWPAWRQGPCPGEQYLVLAAASAIPVCRRNTCEEGSVKFQSRCLPLGDTEVCKHLYPNDAVLGVNATTLVVECVRLSLETYIPPKYHDLSCPPGSKREINGQCKYER